MRKTLRCSLLLLGAACAKEASTPQEQPAGAGGGGPVELWAPGVVYPAPREQGPRGLLDLRGLVHAHSYWSHDACDGEPVKDGVRDPVCFEDFRRGLCQAQHDFVFLTDHPDGFRDADFPGALLYREEKGDVLVMRDAAPVANFAGCPDGSAALIAAGTEGGMMPVGLEGHAAEPAGRGAVYGDRTEEAAATLRAAGAIVLLAHPEDFTIDELQALPVDGFEMFNLHANTFKNVARVLQLLTALEDPAAKLPAPDASLLAFVSEDDAYLQRWGSILARGERVVSTMGTDCHRNSFPALMADGERVDSYRRMMIWFSNHLLVRPEADGRWDDLHLKEALREGRLYGALEALGYPVGFDAHATTTDGVIHELGAIVPFTGAPTIHVTAPGVRGLDPSRPAPVLRVRILRAIEGGFEEVASGPGPTLDYAPDRAGVYRAEIRMLPRHLVDRLGDWSAEALATDLPWIYGNPFYVR